MLEVLNIETREDVRRLRSWPRAANALSNQLRTIAPALRAEGIEIEFVTHHGNRKTIALSLTEPGSPAPGDGGGDGYDGDVEVIDVDS